MVKYVIEIASEFLMIIYNVIGTLVFNFVLKILQILQVVRGSGDISEWKSESSWILLKSLY